MLGQLKLPGTLTLTHASVREGCSPSPLNRATEVIFEEHPSLPGTSSAKISSYDPQIGSHLDLPGHLDDLPRSVADYPLSKFFGRALVLDFSFKTRTLDPFFDEKGYLQIDPRNHAEAARFFALLDELEITNRDFDVALDACGRASVSTVDGVIFYTGLVEFFREGRFELSGYRFFFPPYPAEEVMTRLIEAGINFLGTDAAELENPLSAWTGDELLPVLNPPLRRRIEEVRRRHALATHRRLLGADILIYEQLALPRSIINTSIDFVGIPVALPGVTMAAPVNAYARLLENQP